MRKNPILNLRHYASGTNLYRYSRGIKKPEPQKMTYNEAKHIIGKKEPDFSRTVLIEGGKEKGEKRIYNTVTYEHYNLKRKTKKPTNYDNGEKNI